MKLLQQQTEEILVKLIEKELLYISDTTTRWNDEPHFFIYQGKLNNESPFLKEHNLRTLDFDLTVGGCSYNSRLLALTKCLGEFIERFCLFYFNDKETILGKRNELTKQTLDLNKISSNKNIDEFNFHWMWGKDVLNNCNILIPTQLVYLYNPESFNEEFLINSTSNGAAGGFTHNQTLLSAIYELVERDAFLTMYLNQITPPRIDVSSIKNARVQKVISYCKRYRYEVALFDITNDLQIPTFLTFLLDETKKIESISFGTKSSFNIEEAIIGSIEEVIKSKQWIREELSKGAPSKITHATQIVNLFDRAFYWLQPNMIKNLKFILNSTPQPFGVYKKVSEEKSLQEVINIFKKKNINLYCVDISNSLAKALHYTVYKVIIPELQPLYLNESLKTWNLKRLKETSQYFGMKKSSINPVPHPFL